jgi:DNA-3-methyladenine glycosylase II
MHGHARVSMARPAGFRLQAARDFYAGFVPGSGMAAEGGEGLTLAFRLDKTFDAVVARLTEDRDALVVDVVGTSEVGRVRAQIARMLGLDADAAAWTALGEREMLVGRLQREFPGFFTAAKASPYEAAAWAVIVPRMNMKQAAKIKLGLTEQHGDVLRAFGRSISVFPRPEVLARLERVEGLSDEKVARLRGVAEAAIAGLLDADGLRGLAAHAALAELQTIRGVGPWTASHIYYRGAAPQDELPQVEPRVLHGYAHAAQTEVPTWGRFERTAEAWRPFRMWVSVLLSRHLARTDGWRQPEMQRQRRSSGRALERVTRAARQVRAATSR